MEIIKVLKGHTSSICQLAITKKKSLKEIFSKKNNKTYFGSNPSLGALGLFFNLTHSASLVLLLG